MPSSDGTQEVGLTITVDLKALEWLTSAGINVFYCLISNRPVDRNNPQLIAHGTGRRRIINFCCRKAMNGNKSWTFSLTDVLWSGFLKFMIMTVIN